jgi:gamma-glutamylcyclotransferase (GGCT)/AIG2-like uncharacterized protein YtfP
MNLFTYGTLMVPEVWQAVVGREFATVRGEVQGFAVYRVRNSVYPVMVEAPPESCVAGLIYLDVDEAALAALDDFESELYDRVSVNALVASSETMPCHAYVLPARRAHFATNESWELSRFRLNDLAAYLKRLM